MPLFGVPTPLELEIERITHETNTSEDWSLILDLCDQVSTQPNAAKEGFKILIKRLNHPNPHVVLHTLTLLDACVNNCGKRFHLEVCSREFENEVKRLLTKAPHVKVGEKLLQLIKKWSDMKEFKDDPQLNLIPTLYRQLKKEGYNFTSSDSSSKRSSQKLSTDPNVVTSNEEEEDIAKAIEESLRLSGAGASESKSSHYSTSSKSASSSVYPSFESEITNGTSGRHDAATKETYQVRALYDFEAAEDNELTFKTGEVIVVTDDSDTNWWKGSNHRGEGLFPANFVTSNLSETVDQPKSGKTVQFNEEVRVKLLEKEPEVVVAVDPEKIDKLISLLHEADPTGEKPDSEELIALEEQVALMAPLIDEELQKADRTIASLNAVNAQLVDAMNLYHALMKESVQLPAGSPYYAAAAVPPHQMQCNYQPQMMQQPHTYMGQPGPGSMGMPVSSNIPAYQSPQHMPQQQQQQYPPPPHSQQQQPPSHLPPAYTPSQMPPTHSNQLPVSSASPMHHQHQHLPQQQHVAQQQPQEYVYQQPPPVSYPGSYQQPQ